jgi:hypothetical protein
MVTRVKEPYKVSRRDIDRDFDGVWVLIDYRDLEWSKGYGYIVAYGSETDIEEDGDFDELSKISSREFDGQADLIHGYKNRGVEMLHVL